MSLSLLLKNNLERLPTAVGKFISHIPYNVRPGLAKNYTLRKREILYFNSLDNENKKRFIFRKLIFLVEFAFENVPFYNHFYNSEGFHPNDLKSFEDIQKIPLITKTLLREYSISDRSSNVKGKYVVNTGGSSGEPLSFHILPDSMGHEWAHMHTYWKKLGYKQSNLRLTFGGRSNIKDGLAYDAVRHQYNVDIYKDYQLLRNKLIRLFKRKNIRYLHGYPSSIFEFALYCDSDPELKRLVKQSILGIFLGSEYPHKKFRDYIENVFEVETLSWYGHTERAVLAIEDEEKFVYNPFQTYGYAEAVENKVGSFDLVATSYYNYASPLIRYNTQDEIYETKSEGGILSSFKMAGGRIGDFVLDQNNKKIPLTGLIFGRHHKLFDLSSSIQVYQKEKGFATILFCSDKISEGAAGKLFDQSNVNIQFRFKKIKKPIKTVSGKLKLLVKDLNLDEL